MSHAQSEQLNGEKSTPTAVEAEGGSERAEQVARLSGAVDGLLTLLDVEEVEAPDGSKTQDRIIPQVSKLPKNASEFDKSGEVFARTVLQLDDDLEGTVGLQKTTARDGTVNYVVSRPGYNNSKLEYRWSAGSDMVTRGFSEGFAFSEGGSFEGRERPRTRHFAEPEQLDAAESAHFLEMVEALEETHIAPAENPDVFLGKVRAALSRLVGSRK